MNQITDYITDGRLYTHKVSFHSRELEIKGRSNSQTWSFLVCGSAGRLNVGQLARPGGLPAAALGGF
jgi:hypothetical protein